MLASVTGWFSPIHLWISVKEVEMTRKRKDTDSAKQARRVGKVRRLGDKTTKACTARHMPDTMAE